MLTPRIWNHKLERYTWDRHDDSH